MTAPTNGHAAPGEAPPAPQLLLDLDQAAAALSLSARSLKRLTAEGTVPGVVHLGRRRLYSRAVLEAWTAEGCPPVRAGKQRRNKT